MSCSWREIASPVMRMAIGFALNQKSRRIERRSLSKTGSPYLDLRALADGGAESESVPDT
jgi:glutamine synthetase